MSVPEYLYLDTIFKAITIKTIAIQNILEELKTTARVNGYLTTLPYNYWLFSYLSLERLILIKPAYENDLTEGAKFKKNVDKRILEAKTEMEAGLRTFNYLDAFREQMRISSATAYPREKQEIEKQLDDLKTSSWWDDPKVEVMTHTWLGTYESCVGIVWCGLAMVQ